MTVKRGDIIEVHTLMGCCVQHYWLVTEIEGVRAILKFICGKDQQDKLVECNEYRFFYPMRIRLDTIRSSRYIDMVDGESKTRGEIIAFYFKEIVKSERG